MKEHDCQWTQPQKAMAAERKAQQVADSEAFNKKHGFDGRRTVTVKIHEDLDLDYDTQTKECEIYTEFGTSDDEFGKSLPISVDMAKDMIDLLSQFVKVNDEQVESPCEHERTISGHHPDQPHHCVDCGQDL